MTQDLQRATRPSAEEQDPPRRLLMASRMYRAMQEGNDPPDLGAQLRAFGLRLSVLLALTVALAGTLILIGATSWGLSSVLTFLVTSIIAWGVARQWAWHRLARSFFFTAQLLTARALSIREEREA